MMHETILVTGATGTVGSEVVKDLATTNAKVRAGVHSIIKGDRFRVFPDIEMVEIDFSRPATLKAAFTGVTKVFLITPFTADQVEMGKRFIDEAKAAGVQHIVRLSASGADAEPGIQMGRWHREVEIYLENSGIPYTLLRPTSFMQNFVTYQGHSIQHESKIYLPQGEGQVSYIDARDIASLARVILTEPGHSGKAYDLTGPTPLSVTEVAAILSEVAGRTITYVDVPEEAARDSMSQMHMPNWMVDAMMELNAINKAGYAATVSDNVERITGQPARNFAEFAQDYAASFAPVH
jgi:uncharacterized protein YbjT (DUF2867 family)